MSGVGNAASSLKWLAVFGGLWLAFAGGLAVPALAREPAIAVSEATPKDAPATESASKMMASWIDNHLERFIEKYRTFHRSPEVSFQEEKTAATFAKFLAGEGFEVTSNVGGFGVVGILQNGAGPMVMLRADLDALPVTEETGMEFASKKWSRRTVVPRVA